MIIEKKQKDEKRCTFNWSYFDSAREGLRQILRNKELNGKKILIPAYIGYSSREGSGVFDPIRETNREYIFYSMKRDLDIDISYLMRKIKDNRGNILFLIHYFGFKDNNLGIIKNFAKRYGMTVIEDFAHAFFTFWLNPIIDFDYAIFSIHKLFPVNTGGMILSKRTIWRSRDTEYNLFRFDMNAIISKRINNYDFILRRLRQDNRLYKITILKRKLGDNVPQTFPILLGNSKIRDFLYFRLNELGYGVVSLYHRLVEAVPDSFSTEYKLAERMLNLPVHQDAEEKDLDSMIDTMFRLIKYGKRN